MQAERRQFGKGEWQGAVLAIVLAVAWAMIQAVEPETAPVGPEAEEPGTTGEEPGSWVVDDHLDRRPPREPKGLLLAKGGWKYDCMECHRTLAAKWHLEYPLMEHRDVELKHGNNRFCLNCHHPENRNSFVDYDGSEIAETDVVLLCGKCHGPQYRDWKIGAHGRENGFWKASLGETGKLRCIQCHNPHDPAFKAMEPLPAPTYPARAAGKRVAHTDQEEGESHGE